MNSYAESLIDANKDIDFLLYKLQKGDIEAFDYIFEKYYAGLCMHANSFVNDHVVAEDLVQDFFVGFWEDRKKITIKSSLKSYLFKSIQNRCLDYFKHAKVEQKFIEKKEHEIKKILLSEPGYLIESELREGIEKAIAELPDQCKRIFVMSRYDDKKYREIAEELGLSVKTVEVQIGKALKRLKESLKEYLPSFLIILLFS